MNVQDTILYNLLYYPTISHSRERVLEYLFCVIGNGYEWRDGELCEKMSSVPEGITPVDYQRHWAETTGWGIVRSYPDFFAGEGDPAQSQRAKERYVEKRLAKVKPLIDSAHERLKPGYGEPLSADKMYPISQDSKIMNIPDNIKPDWFDAAQEMLDLIEKLGDGKKRHNLPWAEKARARLNEIANRRLNDG